MPPARSKPVPAAWPLDLYRNEQHFRRLLDMLPAGAYMCDRNGLITYFNQRAVDIWGRAPKLNDPADRFCGSFKLFLADGTPLRHERCWMALAIENDEACYGPEIIVERPSGERLTVLAYANPIRDDHGVLLGGVNVLVDITERTRAERALLEADRSKNEFLATLSHELRNPLAPIRNAISILRHTPSDEPEGRRALEVVERQMQQMTHLIDDLLDVSRITRNKLELRSGTVTLAEVLETSIEISRPLLEDAGHTFDVTMPHETVHIDGDIHRLAQAISNLLNNAARFTAPCGRIELRARRVNNQVSISVHDDGEGIAEDMLTRIFDAFVQARPAPGHVASGLGIGLPLAKRVVELHGGTIEAYSDGSGKGSVFTVRLPAAPTAVESLHETTRERPPPRTEQRVLVVDDSQDVVESTALFLELMNVNVRSATSGRQALVVAESFRPDVVLLDIGMPEMNGLETARVFRQQPWGKAARLIAVTGWGQEEDIRRSMDAGFDDHVTKPMDPDALIELLQGASPTTAHRSPRDM